MIEAGLLARVVVVSASGALSPGPLTTATLGLGARGSWRSGVVVSVGHTLVEFPLVLTLAYGLSAFVVRPDVRLAVGLLGGSALLIFAALTLRDAVRFKGFSASSSGVAPLLVGLVLSGGNPFFLVWWATVGLEYLILPFLRFGLVGLTLMYIAHVWLDYVWLAGVAHFGGAISRSRNVYRVLLAVISVVLFYFAVSTLADSLGILFVLFSSPTTG